VTKDGQRIVPRVLLTGFRPFGKAEVNPTQRLTEAVAAAAEPFAGVAVRAVVLDTDYTRCEEQFRQAVAGFAPTSILSFGLHMGTDEIRLERIAVNVDDAAVADTGGNRRDGQPIVAGGPVGYWSTLPLEAMRQALEAADIPVAMSNHAGTYVCNHLFYFGRHWTETQGWDIRMGFIHVPPFPEQLSASDAGRRGMELETLFRAAGICVTVLARHAQGAMDEMPGARG
jgi:pyroglutamyl-peptidase